MKSTILLDLSAAGLSFSARGKAERKNSHRTKGLDLASTVRRETVLPCRVEGGT